MTNFISIERVFARELDQIIPGHGLHIYKLDSPIDMFRLCLRSTFYLANSGSYFSGKIFNYSDEYMLICDLADSMVCTEEE